MDGGCGWWMVDGGWFGVEERQEGTGRHCQRRKNNAKGFEHVFFYFQRSTVDVYSGITVILRAHSLNMNAKKLSSLVFRLFTSTQV